MFKSQKKVGKNGRQTVESQSERRARVSASADSDVLYRYSDEGGARPYASSENSHSAREIVARRALTNLEHREPNAPSRPQTQTQPQNQPQTQVPVKRPVRQLTVKPINPPKTTKKKEVKVVEEPPKQMSAQERFRQDAISRRGRKTQVSEPVSTANPVSDSTPETVQESSSTETNTTPRQKTQRTERTKPRTNTKGKPQGKPQDRTKTKVPKGAKANTEGEKRSESEAYIWCGIAVGFIVVFLCLSMFSYLSCWQQDADIAYFSKYFDSTLPDAANVCGRFGAIVADSMIGCWIGLGAFFIFAALVLVVVSIFSRGKLKLFRAITATAAFGFVFSLTLGHFWGRIPDVFGSGWGGRSGIYFADMLHSYIGDGGATLAVIFLCAAVLYYAFGRQIRSIISIIMIYRQETIERKRIAKERKNAFLQAQARKQAEERARREREAIQRKIDFAEDEAYVDTEDENIVNDNDNLDDSNVEEEEVQNENFEAEVQTPQNIVVAPIGEENQIVVTDPKPLVQNPNLIALDNGQWALVTHYDEFNNQVFMYLDLLDLPESAFVTKPMEQPVEEPIVKPVEKPVRRLLVPVQLPINPIKEEENDDFKIIVDKPKEVEPVVEPIVEEKQETAVTENNEVEPNVNNNSTEDDVPFTIETPKEESVKIVNNPQPDVVTPSVNTEQKPAETPKQDGAGFEVQKTQEEQMVDSIEINTMKLYDPTAELSSYRKPVVELLKDHSRVVVVTEEELKTNKERIEHTLGTFGIKISAIKATVGPTVTLYEIIPAPGVRINKIKNLEDDIALSLSALGIRIIAPIPGKGTIGIEVPNKNKEVVSMSSVICSAKFQDIKAELPIALGKTIQNETFVVDLAKMPHLLVAGATGQGKSVGLNAIITSLLYKKHPAELKFVLVDPKKVELTLYNRLEKHFLAKMECEEEAIITDTQKVVYTLNSLCKEMDSRYDLLKMAECRNIVEYNNKFVHRRLLPTKGHRYLPYFVVIIDEFADLIMTAGREIETPIARIAQLARAVGIHLIIATQRPTTNIITGVIKANFPARIAFKVSSMIDSRTILDATGANQLIGMGDMLVSTGNEVTRVQCAFIDTPEVEDITKFIAGQLGYSTAYELPEYVPESESGGAKEVDMTRKDPLFDEVARHVVSSQVGSASTIQRKFSIGFNRAGRIVDQLEAAGIVGAQSGSKPREVLIKDPMTLEMLLDQ